MYEIDKRFSNIQYHKTRIQYIEKFILRLIMISQNKDSFYHFIKKILKIIK